MDTYNKWSYDLYLFDSDGTLRNVPSGKICPNSLGEQRLLPNVRGTLLALSDTEKKLGVVSNQGGVSCGYFTKQMAWAIHFEMCNLIRPNNIIFDTAHLGYNHKDGKNYFGVFDVPQKPNPGMIMQSILDVYPNYAEMEVKPRVLYVGDGKTDKVAAESSFGQLGGSQGHPIVDFMWADEFFEWPKELVEENNWGRKVNWGDMCMLCLDLDEVVNPSLETYHGEVEPFNPKEWEIYYKVRNTWLSNLPPEKIKLVPWANSLIDAQTTPCLCSFSPQKKKKKLEDRINAPKGKM